MKSIARLLFALVAVWPFEAAGGVLIVERTTTGDGPAQTHHVQIEGDWMRVEHQTSGDTQAVVFDGTQEVIRIVNYDKKTYSEMTKADVDRLGGRMSSAMAQMQEALKKMQNADQLFSFGKGDEQGFSGVPVRRVFTIGQRHTTTETVDVSRQSFPASTWEVPAGFTRKAYGER